MNASLYNRYETDRSLEIDGIDFDFGDGVVIKARRAGSENKEYSRAMAGIVAKMAKNKQASELLTDEDLDAQRRVFATHCVVSWKGVTDREGNDLLCTPENAYKLFTDLPEFFRVFKTAVSDWTNFKTNWEDETVKKSATSSTGD